jgi:hypothetical protein
VAFTPAADVVLGYAVALSWAQDQELDLLRLVIACLASSFIFCSAVALNDVIDARKDAAQAPDRPIPAGAVTRRQGLAASGIAALAALACAAALGWAVLVTAAGVLVLAVLYNSISRRVRALGIMNLALVRAADVCVGVACLGGFEALQALVESNAWRLLLVYAFYAFSLSGVALGERQARPSLVAASLFLVAAGASAATIAIAAVGPGSEGEWHAAIFLALLVIPAAYGLIGSLVRERGGIESLVGHLVSGYLLVAAAPAAILISPAAGWILAALFLLSRLLARIFPPA